jgi:hypothetical protein
MRYCEMFLMQVVSLTQSLTSQVPHRVTKSGILFDAEALLALHAPPVIPTTKQTSLDILSKSMGNKSQLRHLQRNFVIGCRIGQPSHEMYAFITLQHLDRDFLESITADTLLQHETSHFLKQQLVKLGFVISTPSPVTSYSFEPRLEETVKWPCGANPSYDYFRSLDLLYNIWFIQRGNGVLHPTPTIRNNNCYYRVIDLIVIFSSMDANPDAYKRGKICFNDILTQTKTDAKWATMLKQLREERSFLFDPTETEKNYIAPGSFFTNILPFVESCFVKEILSAPAKLPKTKVPAPTVGQVKPSYIVSEDVTETTKISERAPKPAQTPVESTTPCSSGKIKGFNCHTSLNQN